MVSTKERYTAAFNRNQQRGAANCVICSLPGNSALCYKLFYINTQLAAPRCWFLLNAAVSRSLVDTYAIRYNARNAHLAAKCCQMLQNAGKFFPDVAYRFIILAFHLFI